MLEYLDKIAEKAKELMTEKMSPLIEQVNKHYDEAEKKRWLNTIESYSSNIPVVGFNSGFYDINLLMNHGFMREIKKRDEGPFILKVVQGIRSSKQRHLHS
jgi:hypothetical protein